MLRERLPNILVDPCLYYCCTMHQALAALHSLCTEDCARTVQSMCVGTRNVICEFIRTAATLATLRASLDRFFLGTLHRATLVGRRETKQLHKTILTT